MKKILFTFIFIVILGGISINAFGQQTVKGVVTDADDNSSIPGVTVLIKGTDIGTITDMDGNYKIEVPKGNEYLVFSYIGMKTKELKITGSEMNVSLVSENEEIAEILVVASFAKDRHTPVAFSTISPEVITEKLGSQEYPEILKSTPSVYVTKEGGGYGDSRINLRGFDSNNIGVLINGVPVNDMETGKVYWSNWAGLSDVTRLMQVQRGLGASKLAISSVGGTINIITKTTDAEKGGSVYLMTGNNGYNKTAFTLSTGLQDNGWAVTVSGSKTQGDGYVKGTNFKGYSYFFNLSKRLNKDHSIALTAFGAPQWHNQRSSQHYIETYQNNPDGVLYNSDYGYRNGDVYGGGHAYNKYHKPQISLNHYWNINSLTSLSTALYASKSTGGGRRISGAQSNLLTFNYPSGEPTDATLLTPDGHLDYDSAMRINQESNTGSQAIVSMSNNSHDWYGILSSLNTKIGDINITAGLDGRYYKGYHYQVVDDLLGGKYFLDGANINRDAGTPLYKGDKFSYYNLGEVLWEGVFAQGEYVKESFSAFVSGSFSNSSYRRIDYFAYTPEEGQATDWINFMGYSGKAGVNYNINKHHNVFANGGYFTRAPFFKYAFIGYTNEFNSNAKNERVLSTELGYGYRSVKVNANVSLYRTQWMDKSLTRSLGQETANITGLDALHQGIEAELTYKPSRKLTVKGMISVGNWTWQKDVAAAVYDQNQVFVDSVFIYSGGIHVGDAAQTTAALSIDAEVLPKLTLGLDVNYYDNLYSYFDITTRVNDYDKGVDAWKMPTYTLADMSAKYKFKIGNLNTTLYGKVNNILDTEYIADATDGVNHDYATSPVFYGFGRTWTIGLKIRF
ncbi:MAG: TonB-dependent receptor [Bacteroidales bacterium]|nr:TonB-dependent receptor [Bacteroidales bacterium]